MATSAITSLAILKANWDVLRKDFVETFVPFVVHCVRSSQMPVVSVEELQRNLKAEFGLDIPQHALEVILARAAKRGYLKREHKAYFPEGKASEKIDIERTRSRVLKEHEKTIEKLLEFVTSYDVVWRTEYAEEALYAYLKKYDVDILRSRAAGEVASEATTLGSKEEFLVSAFIRHLFEADAPALEYVITLVKGNMLANVPLFADLNQVDRKFKGTIICCDTTFLLRVFGYQGPRRQTPCLELLSILHEERAEVLCFQHTFGELKGVLRGWATDLVGGRSQRFDDASFRHLRDSGRKPSDIELQVVRLEGDLAKHRINIAAKPAYEKEFQIDEEKLETILADRLGYQLGGTRSRVRDVDSLSAVCRLRRGNQSQSIEECGAILLTCNEKLVDAARRFSKQEGIPVSLAITDASLTTILWLKRPMAASDLPQHRVVADCYAAMEPPGRLWDRYISEIEKLEQQGDVTADDVYLLRSSLAARDELMNTTLGEEHAFVEGTVQEILDRVKSNIKADALALAERERQLREQAEANLEVASARDGLRIEKRKAAAHRMATWLSRAAFTLLMLLLCLGAWAAFPQTALASLSSWHRWVLFVLAAGFVCGTLLNIATGTTIRGLVSRLEQKLTVYFDSKLTVWFEP